MGTASSTTISGNGRSGRVQLSNGVVYVDGVERARGRTVTVNDGAISVDGVPLEHRELPKFTRVYETLPVLLYVRGAMELEAGTETRCVGTVYAENQAAADRLLDAGEFVDFKGTVLKRTRIEARADGCIKIKGELPADISSVAGDLCVEMGLGPIIARTVGGNVHVTNGRGSVSLRTVGGNIYVGDGDWAGNAQSVGGDVNVPQGVDAHSVGGHVAIRPLKKKKSRKRVLEDDAGKKRVRR